MYFLFKFKDMKQCTLSYLFIYEAYVLLNKINSLVLEITLLKYLSNEIKIPIYITYDLTR